jgi:hypothetical protein
MRPIIFTCPQTSFEVQQWLEDADDASDDKYEGVACLASIHMHLANRTRGKLLGEKRDRYQARRRSSPSSNPNPASAGMRSYRCRLVRRRCDQVEHPFDMQDDLPEKANVEGRHPDDHYIRGLRRSCKVVTGSGAPTTACFYTATTRGRPLPVGKKPASSVLDNSASDFWHLSEVHHGEPALQRGRFRMQSFALCVGSSSGSREEGIAVPEKQKAFVLEIDGKAIVAFRSADKREAMHMCCESWFIEELGSYRTNGKPLCGQQSRLIVRPASRAETLELQLAKRSQIIRGEYDGLVFAFLISIDATLH